MHVHNVVWFTVLNATLNNIPVISWRLNACISQKQKNQQKYAI